MRKFLPAFVLLLLVFASAYAQSKEDSVPKHQPVDTVINKPLPSAGTLAKRLPTDTVSKRLRVDSAVVKQLTSDSTSKKLHVDSAVVKHFTPDSIVKKSQPDSAVKRPIVVTKVTHADSTVKEIHKIAAKPPTAVFEVKHSTVKTLSDERYNALLKGEDIDNMAFAGVLNHYPLPDKALKYKVQLGLNPGQLAKLKDIAAGLQRKKLEMGVFIIRNEKVLDSLFVMKQADDGMIIFYTNRYGLYQGELRNAILQACYKTREILSEDQIKKLEGLEKVK